MSVYRTIGPLGLNTGSIVETLSLSFRVLAEKVVGVKKFRNFMVGYMSRVIRNPAFANAKTKVQISCLVTTQRFRYIDNAIPRLPKSESSSS